MAEGGGRGGWWKVGSGVMERRWFSTREMGGGGGGWWREMVEGGGGGGWWRGE